MICVKDGKMRLSQRDHVSEPMNFTQPYHLLGIEQPPVHGSGRIAVDTFIVAVAFARMLCLGFLF